MAVTSWYAIVNHCCCSELLYGTIGTDSMAELKEEDSHTAATTQIHTATGDLSRTLSELYHNDGESAPGVIVSYTVLASPPGYIIIIQVNQKSFNKKT